MGSLTNVFIRAQEFVLRRSHGQTITEYTLVLVAVAVAVIGIYRALSNNVSLLASGL